MRENKIFRNFFLPFCMVLGVILAYKSEKVGAKCQKWRYHVIKVENA